jgi:precorrin-2 dehydrogenase/sirohydrochlorin ferrochelatase
MQTFPAFFPLSGRTVVVAGDGEAADAKARLFAGSPARVVRTSGPAALERAVYAGAALAFVAGADLAFVTAAAAAARQAGVPVNVVDHPELCDFHTPAIVDRDQVVAAVGTAGAAPVMASLLRAELELRIPPAVGALARLLGDRREAIRAAYPDLAARRDLFRRILAGPVSEAVERGDGAEAAGLLEAQIARPHEARGRIVLILAPKEADRLSLRAVRVLNAADVVAADQAASGIVDAHARRDAERAGPDDADRFVRAAAQGLTVAIVRPGPPSPVVEALAALGAAVEVLAPAP